MVPSSSTWQGTQASPLQQQWSGTRRPRASWWQLRRSDLPHRQRSTFHPTFPVGSSSPRWSENRPLLSSTLLSHAEHEPFFSWRYSPTPLLPTQPKRHSRPSSPSCTSAPPCSNSPSACRSSWSSNIPDPPAHPNQQLGLWSPQVPSSRSTPRQQVFPGSVARACTLPLGAYLVLQA